MDYLQKIIPVTALVLIILFILILIVRRLSYRRTSHCKCPACGQEFKPSLMQLIFSVGGKGGQILYCPNCGEKNYLERIPDEEDSNGDEEVSGRDEEDSDKDAEVSGRDEGDSDKDAEVSSGDEGDSGRNEKE